MDTPVYTEPIFHIASALQRLKEDHARHALALGRRVTDCLLIFQFPCHAYAPSLVSISPSPSLTVCYFHSPCNTNPAQK
jgi:hypothetical protein